MIPHRIGSPIGRATPDGLPGGGLLNNPLAGTTGLRRRRPALTSAPAFDQFPALVLSSTRADWPASRRPSGGKGAG